MSGVITVLEEFAEGRGDHSGRDGGGLVMRVAEFLTLAPKRAQEFVGKATRRELKRLLTEIYGGRGSRNGSAFQARTRWADPAR